MSKKPIDPTEIYMHLGKFIDTFQADKDVKWSWQVRQHDWKDVNYWDQKRDLTDTDWFSHFQQKPLCLDKKKGLYQSGIALRLKSERHDNVKLFIVDCDNSEAVAAIYEFLMPVLDARGYDYIWETSGLEGEKGHLFVKTLCTVQLQKLWAEQLFQEAKLDPRSETYRFEIFPAFKPNFIIRAPGSMHLRTGKVNPCTFKDRTSSDPVEIMKMFAAATSLIDSEMRASLIASPQDQRKAQLSTVRRSYGARKTFYFSQRHLGMPPGKLPTIIESVANNCQAVNKLLHLIQSNNFANDGNEKHAAILYLSGLALYNDLVQDGRYGNEGEKWVEYFLSKHRTKAWDSHHWLSDKNTFSKDTQRLVTSCKKWHETLNWCEGCPYKERPGFERPTQLHWGKSPKRTLLRKLNLVSHDWVRKNTFVQVRNRIKELLTSGKMEKKNILVCSGQGTGKSVLIDDCAIDIARMVQVSATAVDLARTGKKILISVPTSDLAIEHKKRIDQKGRAHGIKAFILASPERLFEKFIPAFQPSMPPCPEAANISKHRELGIGSPVYKDKYCSKCPFEKECPFPNQYVQCQEEEYQVVIVQHAHFTSSAAMESILKKHYDVMFIDEAIVDALISQVKAREPEWELLDQLKGLFPWVEDLARWMRDGGYPAASKKVYPKMEDLEDIKNFFTAHSVDWRIPTFLRYYNMGYPMDSNIGLWIFSPLPTDKIPICVITDATPPLEIYQYMLDDENIEVYGDEDILDYRKMNPRNQVIQVLDSTMSKTALRGPANPDGELEYVRFCEILDFIGDKARGEYKDKKILITVYAGEFWDIAEEFLARNYPDIDLGTRVILGKMSIGTNKFDDCDVQFMVAGVYLSARESHMQAFKFRVMANYWRVATGRPTMTNFFPYGVGDDASIDRDEQPVYRIEAIGPHAYMWEYPEFKYMKPVETFHELAERYMIAKTQQALRLRYNDDKPKITWLFDKRTMPSFLITQSVLEDEILGYLRLNKEAENSGNSLENLQSL